MEDTAWPRWLNGDDGRVEVVGHVENGSLAVAGFGASLRCGDGNDLCDGLAVVREDDLSGLRGLHKRDTSGPALSMAILEGATIGLIISFCGSIGALFLRATEAGELGGHAGELGAHVVAGDFDIDDLDVVGAHGGLDGAVEFAFGGGGGGFAAADEFGDFGVIPLGDDVEFSVADFAHGAVAFVVEDENDRARFKANGGGKLGAGHLERAVADEDNGAEAGVGFGDADGGGDGEAHGEVIGGGDEFGALGGADADGAEDGVADIGDDAAVFIEVESDDAHDLLHIEGVGEFGFFERFEVGVGIGVFEFLAADRFWRFGQ